MKKLFASMLLLAGLLALPTLSHAGVPLGPRSDGQAYHSAVYGSTATASGTTGVTAVLAPGSGFQNCFTRIEVQLNSNSTFYMLDGNTTSYAVYGIGLGMAGGATNYPTTPIAVPENPLEPYCLSSSVSTTLSLQGTGAANVINYEGYTTAGQGKAAQN